MFNPRETEHEEKEPPKILDPNLLTAEHVKSKEVRDAELEYFEKMTGTRVYSFGSNEVAESSSDKLGITACS